VSKSTGDEVIKQFVAKFPSETALATAAMRALAAHDERDEVRGADHLAEVFLTEDRKAPLKDPDPRDWLFKNKIAPGAYEFMIARIEFFDQVVRDALLQDISQIVILGAGYVTYYLPAEVVDETLRCSLSSTQS
jgi:O-methyltransferase involved in polyketide biosynthesis